MSGKITRLDWGLAAALFVVVLVLTVVTSNAYGPTYDEPHYASAGVRYAEWWARVFHGDFGALNGAEIEAAWSFNHEHPPLQKTASGFSQRWFGGIMPGLMAMRLPSAVWFALAVGAIFLFVTKVWGRPAGLFGAAAFALLPRAVAHAHFDALDIAIACWFFVSVALTAEALRRNSWGWATAAGVSFGVALAAKLNAFFVPLLMVPWGLVYYRKAWPKLAVAMAAIGPAVFLAQWPWLWIDTAPHVKAYLAFHLGHAAYNVWYLGKLYEYAPWHYPFVLTAVTTPALVLGVSIIGMVRAWPRRGVSPEASLLLFGLAVTLLPNALPSSPKYNGVRLFLPAFPFLAALAGGGFGWVQERVTRLLQAEKPERARMAVLVGAALGAILLVPSVRGVIDTYPYQLAYYNAVVGGTAGATARGFETIYWGQVLEEAPLFLNRIQSVSPRVLVIPKGVIYLLDFQREGGTLRIDTELTGDQTQAGRVDFVLFQAMQSDYTPLMWALVKNVEPAWTVKARDGTPLLLVYDRRAVRVAEGVGNHR